MRQKVEGKNNVITNLKGNAGGVACYIADGLKIAISSKIDAELPNPLQDFPF